MDMEGPQLEDAVGGFIGQCHNRRYHERSGNLTLTDVYPGRIETIPKRPEGVQRKDPRDAPLTAAWDSVARTG